MSIRRSELFGADAGHQSAAGLQERRYEALRHRLPDPHRLFLRRGQFRIFIPPGNFLRFPAKPVSAPFEHLSRDRDPSWVQPDAESFLAEFKVRIDFLFSESLHTIVLAPKLENFRRRAVIQSAIDFTSAPHAAPLDERYIRFTQGWIQT